MTGSVQARVGSGGSRGIRLAAGLLAAVVVLTGCYLPEEDGTPPSQQDPRARAGEPSEGEAERERRAERQESESPWAARGNDDPGQGAAREDSASRANRLAADAQSALESGDYRNGAQLLEEAIDLEPERAVLWHNLAMAYYGMAQYDRAERLGQRAVDLADDDIEVLREAWWVIASARMEQGDSQGARDAAAAASQYGDVSELQPGQLP